MSQQLSSWPFWCIVAVLFIGRAKPTQHSHQSNIYSTKHLHSWGMTKTYESFFRNMVGLAFPLCFQGGANSTPLLSFILDHPLLPHFFFPMPFFFFSFFLPMCGPLNHMLPPAFPSLTSFLILLFSLINLTSFCLLLPHHSLPGKLSTLVNQNH